MPTHNYCIIVFLMLSESWTEKNVWKKDKSRKRENGYWLKKTFKKIMRKRYIEIAKKNTYLRWKCINNIMCILQLRRNYWALNVGQMLNRTNSARVKNSDKQKKRKWTNGMEFIDNIQYTIHDMWFINKVNKYKYSNSIFEVAQFMEPYLPKPTILYGNHKGIEHLTSSSSAISIENRMTYFLAISYGNRTLTWAWVLLKETRQQN